MITPTGPCPARIMIVAEAPSAEDIRSHTPLTGYPGFELGKMLKEAGLQRENCFSTTFLRIQPPQGDVTAFMAMSKKEVTDQHRLIRDRNVLAPIWESLDIIRREIELCQPNVIITLGNLPMWALTGKWGITSWRGSMLQCDLDLALDYQPKVLPTYTPGMVMRQWHLRPITVLDLKRAKLMSTSRELIRPDYQFLIRPDFGQVMSVLAQLNQQVQRERLKLSIDIETRAGHIACIGLAWNTKQALCIPLLCAERVSGYWPEAEECEILYQLHHLLTHPNLEGIGQNFLYDAQYFYRHLACLPRLARDTMIAQHVCFPNMQKSLDFLSSMYCEHHLYWKDDGKTWDAHTGEDQLWSYNCTDAVITYEVDAVEQQNVDAMQLREVHDFQQELFWPVLRSMNRGIRIDTDRRAKFTSEAILAIAEREAWLHEVLGTPLNIKSPLQMQRLFYDEFGLQRVLHRTTGTVTCNDEALGKLSAREPLLQPLVKTIQELRSLGVFVSTFLEAPLDTDGRMRCSYNIAGTETFRFSSSQNAFGTGLNLQNIPSGGGSDALKLPNVRSMFIPDPGQTFFDIDLSSADLRIVVWEADEPEYKAMLREGLDPYTEIAKEFYHDPTINKKDPRRQTFKSFAHGTHYLGTAKGLAERLGLGVHQAEQTQKWYFGRFPKIKRWQDDLKDQVIKRRYVQNVFGYRFYIMDRIEGTIFNEIAAWIPQSTVACLINRGYVAIDKQLPQVQVLLQVHDSLAGQFPTHLKSTMLQQIVACAEIPLPYSDPLVIPVGVKTSDISWGDCK
jgi:DNA polymerase I-like protein with 3'-5' exonuclease and polymerase domains/uracil-DNA glycosylase